MEKSKLYKPLLFFGMIAFLEVVIVNSLIIQSSLVGAIASLGLLSLISIMIAKMLFANEDLFFRCLFGFAALLLLLSVIGFGLMLLSAFTQMISLLALAAMSLVLGTIFLGKKSESSNLAKTQSLSQVSKWKNALSYLAVLAFLFYVAIGFRYLLLARTGEGGSSVWLEISPYFIPVFGIATFLLGLILFLSPIGDGSKLVLVSIYAFLAHSLFLFVWYPSRFGDPLAVLGQAEYTSRTGTIYAFGWLTSHYLVEGIIAYKTQFALTIFFERIFSVDIYWVDMILVPLLWSIFVPSLAYMTAKLVNLKKSRAFPLLTAFVTSLFPSLIIWGAISVPNALGFVFFFLSGIFLLKWIRDGGRWTWLLSLLAVVVTILAHPQPGLFAVVLFLWGNIMHSSVHKVLKATAFVLTGAIYPVALYFYGASFSLSGLLVLDNFLSFQEEAVTIMLVLGFLGLIWGFRRRRVNSKVSIMLFAFYAIVVFEYYFTQYGMKNLPYGASRVLAMGDFFLAPFVALGLLAAGSILGKALSKGRKEISSGASWNKIRNFNSRLIIVTLVSLLISVQATAALYQAYPRNEAVTRQPAAYIIDAVKYIDSDAKGKYVVLDDPIVASVAVGFLGIDHGWVVFGMPDWSYPTMQMYWNMTKNPSLNIMKQAMRFAQADESYFVVWIEHPRFNDIIRQTSDILPVYRTFGDGKLYVFKYPLPLVEQLGPQVKVTLNDGEMSEYVDTRFSYFLDNDINSTLSLTGYSSYNITEYPTHWVFLDLTVNNASRLFDATSDINSFIYVKGLSTNDVLTVKWRWNHSYVNAVWKDDSFKNDWRTHDLYKGTLTPSIVTDGNILNMSASLGSSSYLYYYYVKPVNVSTVDNQYIIVRWKADAPIAIVSYYFELGYRRGADIVPLGSESDDWTVTIVKLPAGITMTYVMIGVSNWRATSVSGVRTLSVDYILISNGPKS